MKKHLIVCLIIAFFIISPKTVIAKEITSSKSPYWVDAYQRVSYTHVGHYVDTDVPQIREGLLWYNQKYIYDIQVSDNVYVSYEGDLSAYSQSSNYNLSVGIGTVSEEFITPPTSIAYQFTIDGMNMGYGVRKTYSEILKQSNYSIVQYSFSSGNVLNQVMATNANVGKDNMTAAVYMKKVKVIINRTHLRQTGPAWNVYWTTTGYSTHHYDIYLEHTLLPITIGVVNHPEVQSGSFYLKHMDNIIKGIYKTE